MNTDFKKAFGAKVKYYRLLNEYSQERLAELIGVSSNTIGYIERGKNPISFTKLPTLCSALKIEPHQLFISDLNQNTSKIGKINKMLKTANDRQLNIIANLIKNILDM